MKRIENHCCDCAVPGYPCRGDACPLRKVEVFYCDKCGCELERVYDTGDEELCAECLKEKFEKK